MRLKPPVTVDEARSWLLDQVVRSWGADIVPASDRLIERIAADMAAISAAEVPAEFEPLSLSLPTAPASRGPRTAARFASTDAERSNTEAAEPARD